MIPDTIGAVLAFLGLIAPGLIFELLRERRRPTVEETAFREASRVALTSFVFTLCGLGAVTVVRVVRPELMPDPGRWLREGQAYVHGNYRLVGGALILVLVVACLVAVVSDLVLRRLDKSQARISHGGVWYHVLDVDRPKGGQVWLHVRLTDGSKFSGYMRHYTPGDKLEDREISLGGQFLRQGEPGKDEQRIGDQWDVVTFRGDKIQFMRAVYEAKDGGFVRRYGQALVEQAASEREGGSSETATEAQ